MKKIISLIVVVSFAAALTGCYGPFRLTQKVHQWNGKVGDKWVNEGVFLVLTILPVYSVTLLADAVVLNSVEFWTGKNPMSAKQIRTIGNGEQQAVMTYQPDSRRLRIDMFTKNKNTGTVIVEPGPDGSMIARDPKGTLLISTADSDGMVNVTGPDGGVVGAYRLDEAKKYLN